MQLFSWNVNGIRAVYKKGALQQFLTECQPDVLGLQEIKMDTPLEAPEFANYHIIWNHAAKKGYSGTAILSLTKPLSTSLNFPDSIASKYDFADSYGDTHMEGRVTTAEFKDFYFVTVYTPNAKDDLSRIPMRHNVWDKAFLEYCNYLQKSKPVIFCGDLNVAHTALDLARPKENEGKKGFTRPEREGIDNILAAGYQDTLRMFAPNEPGLYTWWTNWGGARARNVGWRIDYFFASANIAGKIKEAKIWPNILGSDHCPVSVEIDF